MSYMEETRVLGPHPDYSKNLETSNALIGRFYKKFPNGEVENKLPNGMRVKIIDASSQSGTIPQSILSIAFKPPCEEINCKSTFCNPIFMHQPKKEFDDQVSSTFTHYMNGVKGLETKRPKMVQQELLIGKV